MSSEDEDVKIPLSIFGNDKIDSGQSTRISNHVSNDTPDIETSYLRNDPSF